MQQEFFPITSVSRDDLITCGFDASSLSDEDMKTIAEDLEDAFLDQLFWQALVEAAEYRSIPRIKKSKAI